MQAQSEMADMVQEHDALRAALWLAISLQRDQPCTSVENHDKPRVVFPKGPKPA